MSLDTLAALGADLAGISDGAGTHDLSYSAPVLTKVGQSVPWSATAAQVAAVRDDFNATATGLLAASPTAAQLAALDALGTLLAAITQNESGSVRCLAYSSTTHQLSVQASGAYAASGSQLTAIAATFNALYQAMVASSGSSSTSAARFVRGIIVGGQSLMANWNNAGGTGYVTRRPAQQWCLNPQTGELGPMGCPMPGVSGSADCFIPQMADLLLDAGNLAHLIVGNIAEGGATYARFAKGGDLNGRIGAMLGYFKAQGIMPAAVYWGQGQTDANGSNGTAAGLIAAQASSIVSTFRGCGFGGRIIFTRQTISQNGPVGQNVVDGLTAAAALCDGVSLGANYDAQMTSAHRMADGTHLNATGELLAAGLGRDDVAPYLA